MSLKGPDAVAKHIKGNQAAFKPLGSGNGADVFDRANDIINSRYSTEMLSFPLNVASSGNGLGNHGHYIMFFINSQQKAKLRTSGEEGGKSIVEGRKQYNIPDYINNWDSASKSYKKKQKDNQEQQQINQAGIDKKKAEEAAFRKAGGGEFEGTGKHGGKTSRPKNETPVGSGKVKIGGSTIRIERAETRRLKGGIAMYMPASVQVGYKADYTDTDIGGITGDALDAYNKFVEGNYKGASEAIFKIPEGAKDSLSNVLLSSVGALPGMGGAKEVSEMQSGEIITDRLELAFKGIQKRGFSYTFKMIPKNEREADEIRKIVFAFKANMLPEFVAGRSGRRLVVPNTFDIQYQYMGVSNEYLHHISTCILEDMSVTYGGDRYKTFNASSKGDGAPPVETSITLQFKELELITRERVFEGF